MEQMIEEGAIVNWNPGNIDLVLPEEVANMVRGNLPIPGMIRRIDREIGVLVCQLSGNELSTFVVQMSEVSPVGA